jgi:glutamyl-tRNA synthetase
MENVFDVSNVQKGGARFDFEKAKWINQQHLAKLSAVQIIERYPDQVAALNAVYDEKTATIVELVKERLVLVNDLKTTTGFFLNDPLEYDPKSLKRIQKFDLEQVGKLIRACIEENEIVDLKDAFEQKGEEHGIGLGAFMQLTRVAVVGSLSGPDLFEVLKILGKSVTLSRLDRLINITL